jgi:hypothetical protein
MRPVQKLEERSTQDDRKIRVFEIVWFVHVTALLPVARSAVLTLVAGPPSSSYFPSNVFNFSAALWRVSIFFGKQNRIFVDPREGRL